MGALNVPRTPGFARATALGARSMIVDWSQTEDPDRPVDGFRVELGENLPQPFLVNDGNARNITINGLMPYFYNSSNQVFFSVTVAAFNSIGTSETRFTSVSLPRKDCKIVKRWIASTTSPLPQYDQVSISVWSTVCRKVC